MKMRLLKISSLFMLIIFLLLIPKTAYAQKNSPKSTTKNDGSAVICGEVINSSQVPVCICTSGTLEFTDDSGQEKICCGWVVGSRCYDNPSTGPTENITKGPTSATFNALNPLVIGGSDKVDKLSTPGGFVSRTLNFLFPMAGLILFMLITWGGFEILMNASNQQGMEAGRNRITAAIVGFILLFSTYWLAQIVEVVFGIVIL